MAAADLKKFLDILDTELMEGQLTQTKALQKYRTSKGDKKAGNLTYRPEKITEALAALGGVVPNDLAQQYNTLITGLNAQMLQDFLALEKKFPGEVVVTEQGGGVVSAFIIKKGQRDNYTTLKNSYNKTLDNFYDDFLKLINKPKGLVRLNAKNKERVYPPSSVKAAGGLKFRAQTHEEGGSNVLNQMNDAVYAAIKATNAESTRPNANIKAGLQELQKEGNLDAEFILSIIKNGEIVFGS